VIDYLVGIVLILAPWIFGFSDDRAAMLVPIILGAGVIVYSLLTNYELGVVRAIPMTIHLLLDIIGGVVLAVSPWLFGFSDTVWAPHLVVGVLEIIIALITQTAPAYRTSDRRRAV
jgi:hypothetical protein